jgi:uncharacterized membrane protein HdeD (DUF308 family)
VSEDVQDLKQAIQQMNGPPGSGSIASEVLKPFLSQIAAYWWVELLLGVAWGVIAVVVLKFNHASIITVGVLTGIMLLVFAAEEFALAALDRSTRWLWAIFGILLGFVFLVIGVLWVIQAFAERVLNPLWWMGLISGILMIVLAFVVSGEFFVQRAYTLLIFAGIWALIKAITDIVRAFQIRRLA